MSARIGIAGCGYVGSALAQALLSRGYAVWGLRRRPESLPAGVRGLAADLSDSAALARALSGADAPGAFDVAVFAAAAGRGGDDAYRATYVEGLANWMAALERHAPRHAFFTSSTSVYAQDDGSIVDERSATDSGHYTGARMIEAEAILAASAFPGTSLRLGGIYGPGRTSLLERVRSGEALLSPPPPRYTNRIHRDDAAGALLHLIERALAGRTPDPLYLGVDDEPADQATVIRWLADRMGAPAPRAGPDDPPRAGARPSTNKRCSNARLRASGYAFRYPSFREGYGALIDAATGR